MNNDYGDLNALDLIEGHKKQGTSEKKYLVGQFQDLVGVVKYIEEKPDISKWAVTFEVVEGPEKGKTIRGFYKYKKEDEKSLFFTRQLFIAFGLYNIELHPSTGKEYHKVGPFDFSKLKGKKLIFDTIVKGSYTNLVAPREFDPNLVYEFENNSFDDSDGENVPF